MRDLSDVKCMSKATCQSHFLRFFFDIRFFSSHRIVVVVVVVVVYPGVKCIGQHSALGLALGLGSGPLSSLGVSAILLYLTLSVFPFLSAWVWVVDCHFLRCGNLRLLIKKYTHRKHVEGIMRLFCCYCTLPPFSPHPRLVLSLSLFALLHFHSKWLFLSPLSNGFLLLLYAAWILPRSLICLMTSGGEEPKEEEERERGRGSSV